MAIAGSCLAKGFQPLKAFRSLISGKIASAGALILAERETWK
jgi:hypothetical protein